MAKINTLVKFLESQDYQRGFKNLMSCLSEKYGTELFDNCGIGKQLDIGKQSKKFFGVQFHPEVTHSKQGAEILKRFVIDVCGLHGLWSPSAIIEDAVKSIREQVGDKKVLLGLSGGVDSSVTALLL